jgi:hypothetical protein
MSLLLAVGTVVGATANVVAVWLALRARRRRFARALDREIRDAVWEYARACHESGKPHSLSGFSPIDILSAHADEVFFQEVRNASLEFLQESLKWRLEYYQPSVPRWVLSLLPPADAQRYNLEWAAHLRELHDDGDRRRLRADRRRLGVLAVCLAVVLRARHGVAAEGRRALRNPTKRGS